MLELHPLHGLPEVSEGADLAALLADAVTAAGIEPQPQDVLVVTQKIVSKAEGRMVDLATVDPGPQALAMAADTARDARVIELILRESSAIIRATPQVLVTRHHSGHVMANAGIDRSNLGKGNAEKVLLLPEDADASALALHTTLATRFAHAPAIVISDSFGRPWRMGTVNVAIGAAGLPSIIDQRGDTDRDGRLLMVTQVALADMIASAAGLVAGEAAEGIPAVYVRGLSWSAPEAPAKALVRPIAEDLFR